ncbi:MAG: flavodoxin family protein [Promethearchaeota archaeon]
MENLSKLHVLGIVGSPRRGGNTEVLVDKVLSGVEKAGALYEKVILNELNINPCQACDSCYKTGNCIQKDDMVKLQRKMEKSRIWILGTPIYWWGPTAQFKTFLDRWYSPIHKNFKGKRIILIIPFEGGHERYARHTVGMLKDIFDYLKMDLFETILAPGVNNRGAVSKNTDLMGKAFKVGREIIENLI